MAASCCPECNRFVDLWLQFGVADWLDRYDAEPQSNPTRPGSSEVQSLMFDRSVFSKPEAVQWATQHGFGAPKVHLTPNLIRLRQVSPTRFKRSSFRTISMSEGVKAVVGVPK